MKRIAIEPLVTLDEHAAHAHLAGAVEALRAEAAPLVRAMRGRTIWMINSTAHGGGVSEMMPGMIAHLRDLGIRAEWLVMESADDRFFQLTKRIHNMIHGAGGRLGDADHALLDRVNRQNADVITGQIRDGDIVIVHDPQPIAIAGMLRDNADITTIWRCHIGLDVHNEATRAAWRFLERYSAAYDHAVFTAPDYVPACFDGRSTIIHPALDPLSDKNRPLSVKAVVAILERAALIREPGPRVLPPFSDPARRLQPDGSWQVAVRPDDLGLLTRPIVTQISRWDRLKGFLPLMKGFATFKSDAARMAAESPGRSIDLCRLVLAGPAPDSIADDPESREVLEELARAYISCEPDVRSDIAIIALPMNDPATNALMVNALQRVSTIVAQNSLREGFGLTIAEAMWKAVPVLSNARACGPRQQIRDRQDGLLIADPEDSAAIAAGLHTMLTAGTQLDAWGRAGQRRVHEHFLIYSQLLHWIRLLGSLTGAAKAA